MATRLPTKLGNEPLIDAIFEVRFVGSMPASVVLPGIFFGKLPGKKIIEHLPIAQIPKPLRDADQNLKFAAISRIDWDAYFINVGDFSLSVSCKYPYPGWSKFRDAITKAIEILNSAGIVEKVERYSLKYIDLFPATTNREKVSMLNMKVMIADHELREEPFQMRMEISKDGLIHAVQIVSSANAVLHNGLTKDGLVLDVDTLAVLDSISMQNLQNDFSIKLDFIHSANKAMFFDCLNPKTIAALEPSYE